jgi:phosphoglycerate dehydrogenase-like enzyme
MCMKRRKACFSRIYQPRPLQDDVLSRLLTFPNVLITAHQAFLTHEALTAISEVTVDNVRRHLAGLEPVDERVVV